MSNFEGEMLSGEQESKTYCSKIKLDKRGRARGGT